MVGAIKEICIFIIVAQAVLFFVPGKAYVKYVRILVGIIMILRMTEPVFEVVLDDEKQQEIEKKVQMLENEMEAESEKLEVKGEKADFYGSIEKELKARLVRCESDYEIVSVSFSEEIYSGAEDSSTGQIVITVSEKGDSSEGAIRVEPVKIGSREESALKGEEELKDIYGSCIGVDADRIRIVFY